MKNLPFLAIALLFATILSATFSIQKTNSPPVKMEFQNGDHLPEWTRIDSLENEGLPQSALAEVEKLYETVLKENNPAQVIKCLIYKGKYKSQLEEDGLVKAIYQMEKEKDAAQFPVRPILESMLAEMYLTYLDNNYWRFSNRTETVDFKTEDIRTWTPGQLITKSNELFAASLTDTRIKQVNISSIEAILQTNNSAYLRPILFDFLVFRAIDHFQNERSYLDEPAYKFYLDDERAFSDVADFVKTKFETRDSTAYKFKTLLLFQQILDFHRNDKDPAVLVDADLKRLEFVYTNSVSDLKGELYEKTLERLSAKYTNTPIQAEVIHALANYYFTRGQNFQPMPFWMQKQGANDAVSDKNKWDYRKAFDLAQGAIDKYPDAFGTGQCRALQAQIQQKNLEIQTESVSLPNQSILAKLDYRNVKKVFLKVANFDENVRKKYEELQWGQRLPFLQSLKPIYSWSFELPDDGDFRQHAVELKINPLPLGGYVVLAADNDNFSEFGGGVSYLFMQVSNLAYLTKNENGKSRFIVVHRATGKPLEGVLAEFFRNDYNRLTNRNEEKKIGSARSDKSGIVEAPVERNTSFKIKFSADSDKLLSENWYSNYGYERQSHFQRQTFFFLDRAIYRPGQTIFFKTLTVDFDANQLPKVVENERITVEFFDANYQPVGKLDLKTNEYGTASGNFTAPRSGLLGAMHLREKNGQHFLRVEEYKRPKFEVTFEPVKESFRLNDAVTLTGVAKAYAGSNIDGAKVTYRVVRKARFPYWDWWFWGWWNPWQNSEMEIANGETTTDENGNFKVSFKALPDRGIPKERKPEFYYEISADVADITGETQSGGTSFRAGYVAMEVRFEPPAKWELTAIDSIDIQTLNLNGQPESAKVTLTVQPLEAPKQIYLPRLWDRPDRQLMTKPDFQKDFPDLAFGNEDEMQQWAAQAPVFRQEFDTKNGSKISLKGAKWQPGAYLFTVTTTDKYGTSIEIKRYSTVFDKAAKKPPLPTVWWSNFQTKSYEPGDEIKGNFSTSLKEICVFGSLENRLKKLREGWFTAAPNYSLTQPVTEYDRGGVGFETFAVYKNRLFAENHRYDIPWSNKDLKIEYATFRDKLQPGQNEEWQIKISGPKKEKVAAEMVAAMYDASLDAFASNQWSLSLFPNFYSYQNWTSDNFNPRVGFLNQQDWQPNYDAEMRVYPYLNWFNWGMYEGGRMVMMRDAAVSMAAPSGEPPKSAAPERVAESEEVYANGAEKQDKTGKEPPTPPVPAKPAEPTAQPPKVRTNLNETVFFFPNLMTDAEGNILIKFKMNEALTRWKFLGLAHTRDLKSAVTQREVITQKELMVQPNPPRFFREGDEIEFTAKVSNLTEKELNGSAKLELFDALTNEPIDNLLGNSSQMVSFSAKAGQSARLAWTLKIPFGKVQAVVHRVTAQAGSFSDGEESALPVLTNRMLVTETMPLPVRGGQTKDFVFQSMKNNTSTTLQNHRLTLEFTSNPAWYAVQALPYIMEYPYECTEQVFNRFYANSLATHVANAHPKVKTVFDKWRNYQPAALQSNLTKNQELKTALLEETPWVLNAQSEEQQKQNIALLFDLNRMSYEMESAVQKMADRQEGNGGWSWFPGGRPSWYITQYVVEGFGHLQRLGVRPAEKNLRYRQMLEKAVRFCDFELQNHYAELERMVKLGQTTWADDHLDYMVIHYLYARSFFLSANYTQAGGDTQWMEDNRIPVDDNLKKIHDYYLGQADKYWLNKGMYAEGMLALALQRFGKPATPAKITKSLKERSLNNEELGMYWKYPTGWWWYQAPIETHSLMIEVFREVARDEKSVEDLKVWLLKNKQTTHWKTTKATAGAVYALLLSGDNWLLEDQPVSISFPFGNDAFAKKITDAQQSAEAGTGYFKVSADGKDFNSKMSAVKVVNPNKTVAWGGLYWQYFENLDKITFFEETPLKIKKQLFKTVLSDTGEKIVQLNQNDPLKPGDKLKVRIELRVDRDMEYVHMKDMRASGFEPINVLSTYKWQGGLGYYESTRDAATNFFFDYLPKGTYVFEYPLRVIHKGNFSNGITTIQCMYAPEFTSHSEGVRVEVK